MDSVASFSSSLRIFEMWKNCGFAAKKKKIFGSYCPISLDPVKIFELCKKTGRIRNHNRAIWILNGLFSINIKLCKHLWSRPKNCELLRKNYNLLKFCNNFSETSSYITKQFVVRCGQLKMQKTKKSTVILDL